METIDDELKLKDSLALKDKGNALIKEGNFKEAALLYSQAIKIDPTNASLFSNRSLAYLRLKLYSSAYQDALETTRLNPIWAKGYFRKAEVEAALGLSDEAALSYTQTLQLQPQDVSSVLASIKKVTEEQNRRQYVKEKLPWVSSCVGVIIGVILVILDYVTVEQDTQRNPLTQVGTVLSISFTSYAVGKYYIISLEGDGRRQLHPPGFQDPDLNRQLWATGFFCCTSLLFLDVMFVEIVGFKQNPSKLLVLLTAIIGGGVGISYLIYLRKYFSKDSSQEHLAPPPVDCKLPFVCGSIGIAALVVGFVLDFILREEPSTLDPLNKAAVAFATGCFLWCVGRVYNMSLSWGNDDSEKNSRGNLPDSLWCGGLIVSTCFILADCTVTEVIGLRENPVKTAGFALSIAGIGYCVGSLIKFMKSLENESPQEEVTKDFQQVTEEPQLPEKVSNKYTKAQARHRYKKGKM